MKMNKHYEKWIERETAKGYNEADVRGSADFFVQNKEKFTQKDIFSWDAKELENKIKEGVVSNGQIRRGSYTVIKDNDKFILVRLDDNQSALFWGKSTKWCISMNSGNFFRSYRNNSNSAFYIIMNKKAKPKEKNAKFCIVFYRNSDNKTETYEIYNSSDEIVSSLPKEMSNFIEGK